MNSRRLLVVKDVLTTANCRSVVKSIIIASQKSIARGVIDWIPPVAHERIPRFFDLSFLAKDIFQSISLQSLYDRLQVSYIVIIQSNFQSKFSRSIIVWIHNILKISFNTSFMNQQGKVYLVELTTSFSRSIFARNQLPLPTPTIGS